MGIYSSQDIALTLSGDLQTSRQGDLDLNNSLDTHKSAAIFLLRTDFGDYAPNNLIGCNLGAFIGEINKESTHSKMNDHIQVSLSHIFYREDYKSRVVPFDINEAVGYVFLAGTYYVDGEYKNFNKERITFFFPYVEGSKIQVV